MMKKYLSFTAITYEGGDLLGYLLAWCSLIPQVLLVAEITALLLAETSIRRRKTGLLISGQLANEGVNLVLKRVLQQKRPAGRIIMIAKTLRFGKARLRDAVESFAVHGILCHCSHLAMFAAPVGQKQWFPPPSSI